MKRKIKIKWKNIIAFTILLMSSISLSISLYNILIWKNDSNKTNKQIEQIQELINNNSNNEQDNTSSEPNIEIIEQEKIDESNPYWDYIEMDLININFNKLRSINSDVSGWIQVNGTNINYPFVQANDNKYYLNHSFDKSYNGAGWVFLDYRNTKDFSHKNNIIYAHGRVDGTMFGTLKNALSNGWLDDPNNFVIKTSHEKENYLWQVFSIYHIPTTSDYLEIDFDSDEEFLEFGNMLLNRSSYNFNTSIRAIDKILTLSTCYNDYEKVVLHAKLIKKTTR